ncbi:Integrator complex subunit 7, partial [Cladochytrium tenue]
MDAGGAAPVRAVSFVRTDKSAAQLRAQLPDTSGIKAVRCPMDSYDAAAMRLDELVRGYASAAQPEDHDRIMLEYADFLIDVKHERLVALAIVNLAGYWAESDDNVFRRQSIYKVFKLAAASISCFPTPEFTKRVKKVMDSNNPIARALTLRLFGQLSRYVSEDVDVQYSVLKRLTSSDPIEYESAVFAAYRIAPHSEAFAEAIPEKVARMLKPTNNDTKLLQLLSQTHRSRTAVLKRLVERGGVSSCDNGPSSREAVRTMALLASRVPQLLPTHLDWLARRLARSSAALPQVRQAAAAVSSSASAAAEAAMLQAVLAALMFLAKRHSYAFSAPLVQ